MALILSDSLESHPDGITLPASPVSPARVTFTAKVVDPDATPHAPNSHTVKITLEPANDLTFVRAVAPSTKVGPKVVKQRIAVGPSDTAFDCTVDIAGTGAGLIAFTVTLLDDDDVELDHCDVDIL